jgi:hypothetical protein
MPPKTSVYNSAELVGLNAIDTYVDNRQGRYWLL